MKNIVLILAAAAFTACSQPQAHTNNAADSVVVKKERLNSLMKDFRDSYEDTAQRRAIIGRIKSEFPDFIPSTLTYEETMPSVLDSRLQQYNRFADQKTQLK